MVSPARVCLICKGGRNLCGHSPCPLLPRFNVEKNLKDRISKEFFGPGISVFVGRYGYPDVFVGPLGALDNENINKLDNSRQWFGMEYHEIVKFRSMLLRSKQKENVFSRSRFVCDVQELALASKPADIEMSFKKNPVYRVSFSEVVQPMGPSASLEKLRITENPRIPRKVDSVVSDELKAGQASFMLYKSGMDVNKISTILSSGVLGLEKNKKLVPTRFGITAVDDIIAKELLKRVRTYNSVNSYMVFESTYLDNHFVILMMPGSWEFENFEAWAPGSMWSRSLKKTEILEEYEPFKGRTGYAELEGGGYYASRISVIRALEKMKRQAKVVVFREVYEGYILPLGVWVVRDTAMNAFNNKSVIFNTKEEALRYCDSRLRIPVKEYIQKSKILRQKRLSDF